MISYLPKKTGRKGKEDQVKKGIGEIRRKRCEEKGVKRLEAEASLDHIHILVEYPTV